MEVKGAREAPFIGWADALGVRAMPRRCKRREVEADSAESCPRTREGMTPTCGPRAAVEGEERETERAGLPVGPGKGVGRRVEKLGREKKRRKKEKGWTG